MEKYFIGFWIGFCVFCLLEPLVLNFLYLKNVALFDSLFLNPKSKRNLYNFYNKDYKYKLILDELEKNLIYERINNLYLDEWTILVIQLKIDKLKEKYK